MEYESKGTIVRIKDRIVTINVSGYDYDFPQQMIPSGANVNDILLITKNQIELIKTN